MIDFFVSEQRTMEIRAVPAFRSGANLANTVAGWIRGLLNLQGM
jgi:hypothetical protein